MSTRDTLGGIIHTYQKYDPVNFPSPTAPPPDMVTPAFEHLLQYGDMRDFTDEELANAVRLDPSQIAGLGPSIDYLMQRLKDRKKKILETYETTAAQVAAKTQYQDRAKRVTPPDKLRKDFDEAVAEEQLRDLEMLYYRAGDD